MNQELINHSQPIQRPSLARFLGEPILVWKDIWQSLEFRKSYQTSPSGDGHPVLVLPGLLGNDQATKSLREFVKNLGYTPYGWELGINLGNIQKLNKLLKKIEELHNTYQAKVSIIGWSLGGVYARQLGKRRPDLIRQIITMGSPFANIEESNNAAWFYKLLNSTRTIREEDQDWALNVQAPAPVPSTAIYSKADGIVPWRACMEQPEDHWHQNIEVYGSHFGLPYIPAIWVIIEDRLKLKQREWQHFQRKEGLHELVKFPSLEPGN